MYLRLRPTSILSVFDTPSKRRQFILLPHRKKKFVEKFKCFLERFFLETILKLFEKTSYLMGDFSSKGEKLPELVGIKVIVLLGMATFNARV